MMLLASVSGQRRIARRRRNEVRSVSRFDEIRSEAGTTFPVFSMPVGSPGILIIIVISVAFTVGVVRVWYWL